MNLFRLAELQLFKEKKPINASNVLEVAIKIRKFMDRHPKKTKELLGGVE